MRTRSDILNGVVGSAQFRSEPGGSLYQMPVTLFRDMTLITNASCQERKSPRASQSPNHSLIEISCKNTSLLLF